MTNISLFTSAVNLAEVALHWLAAALVLLNETSLLSSLWIVSESPPTSARNYNVLPNFTAIAYALSEPIWTLLLLNFPLPSWMLFPSPWFLQTIAGCHGVAGAFAASLLSKWLESDLQAGKLRSVGDCPSPDVPLSDKSPPTGQSGAVGPSVAVYATYLLPVQTAALQNAALLIWAQHLQLPYSLLFPAAGGLGWEEARASNVQINLSVVYVYVIFTGLSNYFWCRATSRAWRFRSGRYLRAQLGYLVVLLVLRLGTRKALGIDCFPGWEIL